MDLRHSWIPTTAPSGNFVIDSMFGWYQVPHPCASDDCNSSRLSSAAGKCGRRRVVLPLLLLLASVSLPLLPIPPPSSSAAAANGDGVILVHDMLNPTEGRFDDPQSPFCITLTLSGIGLVVKPSSSSSSSSVVEPSSCLLLLLLLCLLLGLLRLPRRIHNGLS